MLNFLNRDELELIELYHLAPTALAYTLPTRWQKMDWAARAYAKEHPDRMTVNRAYRILSEVIE